MESEKGSILTWQDYSIIAIMMLVSSGIGVYYRFTGGRQKTIEEYFRGNGQMNIFTVSIGMMVSYVSAISILGNCAEVYTFGFIFIFYYGGAIIALITVSYVYLPVFYELKIMTVYEYLEKRFGRKMRVAMSISNLTQVMLYTGVVLYAPSLAIEATTGLSSKTSISIIAIICMFYSTIGGIKAVLITDILQAILMFSSLFCILIIGSNHVEGGILNVWSIATEGNRLDVFDFRLDPTIRHTAVNLLIGGIFIFSSIYGVSQVEVQRLLTVKSLKDARLALFINVPLMLCICIMTMFAGLIFFAIYKDCDPISIGEIASNDRIMPYFAATKLTIYPGLIGLFIAGIFSASLSSISAILNSVAAIILEDYVKPLCSTFGKNISEQKAVVLGKFLALMNGCICLVMAFLVENFGSLTTTALSITGAICGPLLGIFTLGMIFEGANEVGSLVGVITALTICLWMNFGYPKPQPPKLPISTAGCNATTLIIANTSSSITVEPIEETEYFYLYRISYMWYSAIGVTITVVVGLTASYIYRYFARKPERELDPRLFTPFVARRIRKRRADITRTTISQVFTLEEPSPRRGQ